MIKLKGWALALDDGFVPDFSIKGTKGNMENVYQIHSSKKSAQELAKKINDGEKLWKVVPVLITNIK